MSTIGSIAVITRRIAILTACLIGRKLGAFISRILQPGYKTFTIAPFFVTFFALFSHLDFREKFRL
jgi:hypothetical protein